MRMHIELADDLVAAIDAVAGDRGRSGFVRAAVTAALQQRERAQRVRAACGVIADSGHDWDDDVAAWVHAQRRGPGQRVG